MASPPAVTINTAVARFLELEGSRSPDFSGCLVLVPHHHAAQDFRRALRLARPEPFLLPPRLLTLPEFARSADVFLETDADSRRIAELHDFLHRSGQLPQDNLWQAAQELATLLDALDMADCALDTARGTQALHTHAANAYLSVEAGIARAVWQAFRQAAPGKVRVYGARLAWLATHAAQPLYTLGLMGLGQLEKAFLQAWQKSQPVQDLPAPTPYSARAALLAAVWQQRDPPLAQRAQAFAALHPASPLSPEVCVCPAHNLEASACTAEQVLLEWLREGRRRIALVALDRLLARRLRALLERRDILVQDETGWAFSTSAVSHVLERWLTVAGGRVWHRDLLDLLKSPFIFADAQDSRIQAVHALEAALRHHGAPADLAGHQSLARQEGLTETLSLLQRLASAQTLFTPRRLGLGDWTKRLLTSLSLLGAEPALATDPIGQQMLDLLRRLQRETASLPQRFTLADWRRWLFLHLEQATFSDTSVDSPIRLTHLAAAHHRDLEGVLILGAGAAHLPGGHKAGLFNNATLRQLGLPDAGARERDTQAMLMDLLGRVPRAAFVWQAETDGDPTPLSPWLVHLEAFHQAAWGQGLRRLIRIEQPRSASATVTLLSAPKLRQAPQRLSVSAWQSLVACPYQFFARHVLALNERDEMPEEMDKAEYGSLVHRILARFHREHPSLEGVDAATLEARLTALTESVFAPVEARDYQAGAWRLRWLRHVPGYIAWALRHEAEGWRFQAAEIPLERPVAWSDGGQTLLYGRADRIDSQGNARAVLDYKTQSRATLKGKLDAGGEDVQLAAYAWLAQAVQAGFVSVDEKKVALMQTESGEALAEQAAAEATRIAATMQALSQGQPLPAHGAPGTCAWCEMEGLCRRAHRHKAVP